MNKTDSIIKSFTELKEGKELIETLSAHVLASSVVYGVSEDTVLGIICALTKAQLATKKETKKQLEEFQTVFDKFFGFDREE